MRTALVGHRGVGKTSLLDRIRSYYSEAGLALECFDLDREVTAAAGRPIHEIFRTEGEEAFRRLERAAFKQIDDATRSHENDVFLSLGAGFDPALIPETWRVLWVRRATDAGGRIFMDRPRLNSRVTAIEEFKERYHRRQTAYKARADEVLWLDEGLESPDDVERSYVLGRLKDLGGAITLSSDQFRSAHFETWLKSRLGWGVKWFELRDDLLSESEMSHAVRLLPDDRVLVSFRAPSRHDRTKELIESHGLAFDWPVEMGSCDWGEPRFYSLHERRGGQSLTDALARFPSEIPEGTSLKAALPVADFSELMEARSWQQADDSKRVFLPLSNDGRWSWYRLLIGENQSALNFFRESDGSGADQPTLLQWARRRRIENASSVVRFAAVLGDPVHHSRTPLEQMRYFEEKGASVYAIRVTEIEWRDGAIDELRRLGLRWAAVTAPLKTLAYESSQVRDGASEQLKSVNTLLWEERRDAWLGANTDLAGFALAIEKLGSKDSLGRIGVWGGGGTLNVIKAVLPEAQLFSLRTGENREKGPPGAEFLPETVVWAVGGSRANEGEPPPEWKPRLVVDLNYSEDSPGRAFALQVGARYVSGLTMFRAQAEAQRKFWTIEGDTRLETK